MNKEQQDLAWKCLPKEVRDRIKIAYKSDYVSDRGYQPTRGMEVLQDIFGHNNLTSDTEPEKMLMVSKKRVLTELCRAVNLQNDKEEDWIRAGEEIEFTLMQLFGDKCLPDEEKPKPKFKVGDKVIVIDNIRAVYPNPMTIKGVTLAEDGKYRYNVVEYGIKFHEDNLEAFTEESRNLSQNIANCDKSEDNKPKDNMEEKELNLAELLRGCEGEEFFSISVGKVMFKAIYDFDDTHKIRTIRKDAVGNEYNVNFHSDGRRNKAGLQDLYPSEDLLRKYPLDPYSAWMKWKEARKPKRWRAEYGETYYSLRDSFTVCDQYENNDSDNDCAWNNYNYFRTEEEAQQAAEAIREALQKFNEQNAEI